MIEIEATVDRIGQVAALLFFIYLGACCKEKDNKRTFVIFLFSLWCSFWRAIIRESFSSPLSAAADVLAREAMGAGNKEIVIKVVGEGQKLLLPTKRREIVEEIRKFQHIRVKDLKAVIVLQDRDVRFSFYARQNELDDDKGRKEWARLGILIEEEEGALFLEDCLDEKGMPLHLIEAAFTDEGRKAKQMAVPYNFRLREEARTFFWCVLAPFFVLSLFVVHWAVLIMLLLVPYFLYKR